MKKLKMIGLIIIVLILVPVLLALFKTEYHYTFEQRIKKPLAVTFSEFMKVENMDKWLTGFRSIERISGKENEVGSKYKVRFEEDGEEFEMIETLKEIKQNERFAFEMENEAVWSAMTITFSEIDKETSKISVEQHFKPKLFFIKMFMPFVSGTVEARNEENYRKLKALIETKEGIQVDSTIEVILN